VSTSLEHWQRIYSERDSVELSWYEDHYTTSLALIEEAALQPEAAILDAGGGDSNLTADLVSRGYHDITIADISQAALARVRSGLGDAAAGAEFVVADLRDHHFARQYDLWHDRAVFHFMVAPGDRDGYLATLRRTLRARGHLILATFGPGGPTRCSGLPVDRYSEQQVSQLLGSEFELISSRIENHTTPSGATQQFLYGHWSRQR
jgi:SAM-dependent methyltransferase